MLNTISRATRYHFNFVQLFYPLVVLLEEISKWDDRNSSTDANTLDSSISDRNS